MAKVATDVERAREAMARHAWGEAYDCLHAVDVAGLSPPDLEAFADSAWWTSRLDESLAIRQRAYAAFAAGDEDARAGAVAARLCIEHFLRGEPAVAGGWLMRSQRHLRGREDCAERAFLDVVESNVARFSGQPDNAVALARHATETAERFGDRDLLAMAIHSEGLAQIAAGRVTEGLSLLDEAMTFVLAGELSPYFTGAVFCNVLEACLALADLRRAGEWSEAAVAWGESLDTTAALYPGLCRVNRAEVASLRGDWDEAEREALRACDEVSRFDPSVAAPAWATIGDIFLRRGDLDRAEEAFTHGRDVGFDPQPGLALLRLAQGKTESAQRAIRAAVDDEQVSPLRLGRLLTGRVEIELAAGDGAAADAAASVLEEVADEVKTPCLEAMAAGARGIVALWSGDASAAAERLRRASRIWQTLGLPYETARSREMYGLALRALGHEEDASLELRAAVEAFERLGAAPDARRVGDVLGRPTMPAGLTPREAEVLQLVASGKTNREIGAELVISEHTVARHLQNIFAKVGVSSRAAATAFAFEHRLA